MENERKKLAKSLNVDGQPEEKGKESSQPESVRDKGLSRQKGCSFDLLQINKCQSGLPNRTHLLRVVLPEAKVMANEKLISVTILAMSVSWSGPMSGQHRSDQPGVSN